MSEQGRAGRYLERLQTMSGAELADRLRQYSTARIDWLRYKSGAQFAPRVMSASPAAKPNFYFEPSAVPALCVRFQKLFPDAVRDIVARAERISEHHFDLLGYREVDYGSSIDWHADRVHGKRAPRKPWFQIRYLDFGEVGDSKVIWELNRHQHLVTLAKAFRLTGERKFASELFSQWEHWESENPYPIGINWASSLEVAFRSLAWVWMYFLLADSDAMPAGFRSKVDRSLAISGRHIETYLSTYFSPNTHLLGEAVALFVIGTMFPEIPSAGRWKRRGWDLIEREAGRQVHADGLHFEHAIYYHVYALDLFMHAAVLASLNQISASPEFDRKLEKMLEALAVLSRDGMVSRFGDDDGGRVFDPARNRVVHLLDPLAVGAVLFGRGDFKSLAGGPREEMLWLLGEAGIEEFGRIPPTPPPQASLAFRDSGLYVMTADEGRMQVVVDAGAQGAQSAGHGHADALSITARAGGQELLVDPGTLEYAGKGEERDRFRGTRAHNTLVVAGLDQAEPRGPFSWERLPNVTAEGWIAGVKFDLFVGSHDGYARLPEPAVHRRYVFLLKSGIGMVRDQALGRGAQQLDLFWHVGTMKPAGTSLGHPRSATSELFAGDDAGLRLVMLEDAGWTCSVEEDFVSPVYGQKEKAFLFHASARKKLPAECLTVFQSESEAGSSVPENHRVRSLPATDGSEVVGYSYRAGPREHFFFFGKSAPWKWGPWSSDAEFLYWTAGSETDVPLLICCRASFVASTRPGSTGSKPGNRDGTGEVIVSATERVLRCEVWGRGDEVEMVCSDGKAALNRDAWKRLTAVESRGPLAGLVTEEKR
jgi:heparinase II/III-like protein